ncbi:MAG: M2 family metallopeptidase [bacterium]|nr:M2 family metallopeptidase [bacterium]
MNIRVIAGLGMFLLAGGLMVVWWVGQRTSTERTVEAAALETPAAASQFQVPLPVLGEPESGPADVDSFLTAYDVRYRTLHDDLMQATWASATDSAAPASNLEAARRTLADFTGSRTVIGQLRRFRTRDDLTSLQDRRLGAAWRLAAELPATRPENVARTIAAERVLADTLAGHRALLRLPEAPPRRATAEEIRHHLAAGRDTDARQAAWEAGVDVGREAEPLLADLRDLRNANAREMGYSSWFALQADDLGLTSAELLRLLDGILDEVMPLYRQLHIWTRHELAGRYGQEVPARLPVHWLDDLQGARWPGVAQAPGGPDFTGVEPTWIVDQGAGFFLSLGFDPLTSEFWERSRFSGTAGPPRVLHLDLDEDLRVLAHLDPDFAGFRTAHAVLGRTYHLRAASTPRVPPLLRIPPDRTFGAAVGDLAALAAGRRSYLVQMGLLAATDDAPVDVRRLLVEALTGPVVAIPYLCGTVAHFEHDLYEADLPARLLNARWWEHAARWQGIEAPYLRGEQHGDAAAVPEVLTSPARGHEAALATVVAHQLHRYVCGAILHQDVHAANWFGSRQAGEFLHSFMALGATADGADVLRRATGEEISAAALVEYYAPLMTWLERENAGRSAGF